MNMKFKAGDLVRVIGARRHKNSPLIGTVTTVIGFVSEEDGHRWYEVDWPSPEQFHSLGYRYLWVAECDMVPIYDGNEPVAWSDCVWQPSKISV